MQNNQEVPDALLVVPDDMTATTTLERRGKSRIYDPFPAIVSGVDASGITFKSRTIIDNISNSGLYLRLMRRPEHRTKLYIIVQLSNAMIDGESKMRLHLSGEVLRVEPRLGGACGLAISIKHNRVV
jgi:hypothetical protein